MEQQKQAGPSISTEEKEKKKPGKNGIVVWD